MRKISATKLGLAVLTATLASLNAGYAVTIYVNDNWGASPARSNSTIPYEDQVEDRIWVNPQTGNYLQTALLKKLPTARMLSGQDLRTKSISPSPVHTMLLLPQRSMIRQPVQLSRTH